MTRETFEARLRAEGYPQIEVSEHPANTRNAEHSHTFDVRALVLEGEITLTVAGTARTYRAGE
jgi:quercetin dioxygenase-like cupin family protein